MTLTLTWQAIREMMTTEDIILDTDAIIVPAEDFNLDGTISLTPAYALDDPR